MYFLFGVKASILTNTIEVFLILYMAFTLCSLAFISEMIGKIIQNKEIELETLRDVIKQHQKLLGIFRTAEK